MTNETLVTIEKMLEPLPDTIQKQIVEHLREYIAELQNEWDRKRLYQEKATKTWFIGLFRAQFSIH